MALRTLANGVRLLALPMPHLQSVSVGVFLRVGSRDETSTSNGISHVLEHMAFKGTHTRSVQEINLDAERLGAEVNAFTGKDITGYFMTGLGWHAQALLGMIADIVLNSVFPEHELQRELQVIRQEAIEYEEDPEDSAGDLLDRAIWGDDPMGMPVIGTVANIEGFTRQDLVRHVQTHYVGEKTVVVAAGNFDVPAWLEQAAQLFAGMPASADPAVALPPQPAKYVGQALAQRFTQVSQVFVNLAYPLVFEQLQDGTRSVRVSWPRWRPICWARGCRRPWSIPCVNGSDWPIRPMRRWRAVTCGPISSCMPSRRRTSSKRWWLRQAACCAPRLPASTPCIWSGPRTSWRSRGCVRVSGPTPPWSGLSRTSLPMAA